MFLFFFNDTATTEIYTLSLHDALPICLHKHVVRVEVARPPLDFVPARGLLVVDVRHALLPEGAVVEPVVAAPAVHHRVQDRKSTRLNSSHANISYAVFCLKKKKNKSSI